MKPGNGWLGAQDQLVVPGELEPPDVQAAAAGMSIDTRVFAAPRTLLAMGLAIAAIVVPLGLITQGSGLLLALPLLYVAADGVMVRVRVDKTGIRAHCLLPLTGLKTEQIRHAAVGMATLPWIGGAVIKSGGVHDGALEHALVRSGPAVVVSGPYRLRIAVSARDERQARQMAALINGYKHVGSE